jgi:hypothetical protein
MGHLNVVLLEKVISFWTVHEILHIIRYRVFFSLFTSTLCFFLSWPSWIQSTHSHPVSLRSILIPFLLLLGLPSDLFRISLRNRSPVCAVHVDVIHFRCPLYLTFLDLIALFIFGEAYKSETNHCVNFPSLLLLPLS